MNFNVTLIIVIFLVAIGTNSIGLPQYVSARQYNGISSSIENDDSNESHKIPYPPCKEEDIPHYTAFKISSTPKIDGQLNEKIWKDAPRSSPAYYIMIS